MNTYKDTDLRQALSRINADTPKLDPGFTDRLLSCTTRHRRQPWLYASVAAACIVIAFLPTLYFIYNKDVTTTPTSAETATLTPSTLIQDEDVNITTASETTVAPAGNISEQIATIQAKPIPQPQTELPQTVLPQHGSTIQSEPATAPAAALEPLMQAVERYAKEYQAECCNMNVGTDDTLSRNCLYIFTDVDHTAILSALTQMARQADSTNMSVEATDDYLLVNTIDDDHGGYHSTLVAEQMDGGMCIYSVTNQR